MSPLLDVEGIPLFYEEHGSGEQTLLLIAGRGGQLVDWHDELVAQFVAMGFRVIRFDNRDSGFSFHFDDVVAPDLEAVMNGEAKPPYVLEDMGRDAANLLRLLGVEQAVVLAHSMGAMIAQTLLINDPELVTGAVLIAPNTGAPEVGMPATDVKQTAAQAVPAPSGLNAEESLVLAVVTSSRWTSWGLGVTEEDLYERLKARHDRRYDRAGAARHNAAILGSSDRTKALEGVKVPVVVIHGKDDPLIGVDGGEATAAAIPDAELIVIDQLRHDLPRSIWPTIVDAVERVRR